MQLVILLVDWYMHALSDYNSICMLIAQKELQYLSFKAVNL